MRESESQSESAKKRKKWSNTKFSSRQGILFGERSNTGFYADDEIDILFVYFSKTLKPAVSKFGTTIMLLHLGDTHKCLAAPFYWACTQEKTPISPRRFKIYMHLEKWMVLPGETQGIAVSNRGYGDTQGPQRYPCCFRAIGWWPLDSRGKDRPTPAPSLSQIHCGKVPKNVRRIGWGGGLP